MSMQLVLGPSGAGKSHYIYEKIIKESIENPDTNYILLVPEQYSMALQRKMVMLHPNGGTLNIDVIGFNRLAYRVFDELNVKTSKVLEDFGKSMLIRRVSGEVKECLKVYKNSLNKNGFIDEVKSLMSEFYQYDFSVEDLSKLIASMEEAGDESVLLDKLKDMETIIKAFQSKLENEYIVAEQLTDLLSQFVFKSQIIKKSVVVMDGFTGFTPIQLKLIGTLLASCKKLYSVHTIDKQSYEKSKGTRLLEHELFYLTDKTIESLKRLAKEQSVMVEPDICVGFDEPRRWNGDKQDLLHLQRHIFRYPYQVYDDAVENIFINSYGTSRKQLKGVCENIFELVKEQGFRYKDIAIVSGNFDKNISAINQIFPLYNIPYFLDYSRPVKNNACVDCLGHALRIIQEDFSYDSVFSFLKSGVLEDISDEDIEELENYCLAKGIRGYIRWSREWKCSELVAKDSFMELIKPFYKAFKKKNATVSDYTQAIVGLMTELDYENKLEEYKGLYDKLVAIVEKLDNIMGDDILSVKEFNEILDVGLKELSLGVIPSKLDMVLIGDITRTRLADVKVLFIIDANEGVIPSNQAQTGIISDKEKERLISFGVELAPTDKVNSFVEQLYLYTNMTTPSHRLYVSYTNMSNDNTPMSPSYIIGRIKNLYKSLEVTCASGCTVTTVAASRERFVEDIKRASVTKDNLLEGGSLYKAYQDFGEKQQLDKVFEAMEYSNIPRELSGEVIELLRLRMMSQSISKLEKYASCAYSYFLRYTLGLKERENNKVDNRETGNILHTALEGVYRHVHDNLGNDWESLSEEQRDKLMEMSIDAAWEKELDERDLEGGRYSVLKESLYRIGKRTIRTLNDIDSKDTLKPEYFEYRFSYDMKLDDDNTMNIKGVVDRGDVSYNSLEDVLRLRVMDYKSGNQKFELNKLYAGMQLQLAIYTNIMLEIAAGKGKLSCVGDDTAITPSGMYYYRMKDPYIDVKNEEELEKKRSKELGLEGLENKDNNEFELILRYADSKVKELAGEILQGRIDKNPLNEGQRTTCDNCPYLDCCRFDEKYGGNKYKHLRYKNTVKERNNICNAMKKELGMDALTGEEVALGEQRKNKQ